MTSKATLYYCYDPMCSWCWGFKPVWDRLQQILLECPDMEVVYVLGGLAPETDEPMGQGMRTQLQQTWRQVAARTGVRFNHEFWTRNVPRRSTWPACKAALVAREHGQEKAMYEAIQRLYYEQAGNPSDYETLCDLAEQLGLDRQTFRDRIHSPAIDAVLHEEIMLAEHLGAQGLPGLILEKDGNTQRIAHSYTDLDENRQRIEQALAALNTMTNNN